MGFKLCLQYWYGICMDCWVGHRRPRANTNTSLHNAIRSRVVYITNTSQPTMKSSKCIESHMHQHILTNHPHGLSICMCFKCWCQYSYGICTSFFGTTSSNTYKYQRILTLGSWNSCACHQQRRKMWTKSNMFKTMCMSPDIARRTARIRDLAATSSPNVIYHVSIAFSRQT